MAVSVLIAEWHFGSSIFSILFNALGVDDVIVGPLCTRVSLLVDSLLLVGRLELVSFILSSDQGFTSVVADTCGVFSSTDFAFMFVGTCVSVFAYTLPVV